MKHTPESIHNKNENNKTKIFRKEAAPKDPMALSAKIYADSMPEVNQKSGRLRFAPAVLFAVFLFGLAIWFIVNPKLDYSSAEKRYLQKFPEASFENISSGKFGTEFESYFADHFPARNMWVGFNSYYTLGLGNNGANGVYHGKDGYLINKPVSVENNVDKNLDAIVDFKQNLGGKPLTVMFAPSTGYLYGDKLPLIHDLYRDDVYFNNAKRTLSDNGIGFVDLRESFREAAANGEQLYYRTDHHWTTAGAYLGYTKLCRALGKRPVEQSALNIETYPQFYGTTYSTSGFWLTQPDSVQVWSNPANGTNIHVTIQDGTESKESDSLYFYNHLDEDDKYPVFLDGNHAVTTIENKKLDSGTLLVVKDSFSHCLAPFLAENYRKVILVDMRYYKLSVSDLAKSENADRVVVLYGIDNFATDTDLVWIG
ncbi:MAG: hypothetical protein IJ598_05240 [Ruminococcus sp.]|nr:hypothetical protein [Ruminococcus sp.]